MWFYVFRYGGPGEPGVAAGLRIGRRLAGKHVLPAVSAPRAKCLDTRERTFRGRVCGEIRLGIPESSLGADNMLGPPGIVPGSSILQGVTKHPPYARSAPSMRG